jgi:phosphate transport system substrate-binding protein
LLLREPGDSNLLIIQKHLPAFREITFPGDGKVVHTDSKMLEMINKYKYSLGLLTFSAVKGTDSAIHPLSLDGIAPTPENARSHKYQLICDYALVYKEKRLNDLARSFLDFIFSKNCQQLMKQHGVVSVNKE